MGKILHSEKISQPLRIGLLIDSFTVPAWAYKIIEEINLSSIATIVLIIRNLRLDKRTFLDDQTEYLSLPLFYRLYNKFDNMYFSVRHDAFYPKDISEILKDYDTLDLEPLCNGMYDDFPNGTIDTIMQYRLDVVLKFGFRTLRNEALQIAKCGVWDHGHHDELAHRGDPKAFWEVFKQQPFTGASLKILSNPNHKEIILDRCRGYTDKFSVKRNRNFNAWRSSQFVLPRLTKLYQNGTDALDGVKDNHLYTPFSGPIYGIPGNSEMSRLLCSHFWRYLKKQVCNRLFLSQWAIAFKLREENEDPVTSLHGFTIVKPPMDRFWADPFVMKQGDMYYIFLEELPYSTQKGHLCVMEVDNKGNVGKVTQILEKEYHLSYPFVFEYEGQIYMLPETSANKTIEVYRATTFPFKWELHNVLMKGVNAVDTTLVEYGGNWWMFSIMGIEDAPNEEQLFLFYSDNPFGPWTAHRCNPFISDCRRGRQAGRLFFYKGSLYRPSQESTKHRGYALSINRITRLDKEVYQEEQVARILPEWDKNVVATHTLNSDGGMTVIDVYLKRRKW